MSTVCVVLKCTLQLIEKNKILYNFITVWKERLSCVTVYDLLLQTFQVCSMVAWRP